MTHDGGTAFAILTMFFVDRNTFFMTYHNYKDKLSSTTNFFLGIGFEALGTVSQTIPFQSFYYEIIYNCWPHLKGFRIAYNRGPHVGGRSRGGSEVLRRRLARYSGTFDQECRPPGPKHNQSVASLDRAMCWEPRTKQSRGKWPLWAECDLWVWGRSKLAPGFGVLWQLFTTIVQQLFTIVQHTGKRVDRRASLRQHAACGGDLSSGGAADRKACHLQRWEFGREKKRGEGLDFRWWQGA